MAATNRNLEEEVAQGRFREDLFYRLAVVRLHLPTLRERQQEVPLLARHFLDAHRERLGVEVEGVEADAADLLAGYSWPGDIRELENVLERAAIMCEGKRFRVEDLPSALRAPEGKGGPAIKDLGLRLGLTRRPLLPWMGPKYACNLEHEPLRIVGQESGNVPSRSPGSARYPESEPGSSVARSVPGLG